MFNWKQKDINLEYHPISVNDIFTFECEVLDTELYDDKLAESVYDALHARSRRTQNTIGKAFNSPEYLIDINYLLKAKTIKQKLRLGYFELNGKLYDLDSSDIIEPSDSDYAFFFALKLRQYILDTNYLFDFLEEHRKSNYKKKKKTFAKFLRQLVTDYDFLSNLSSFIEQYIVNIQPHNPSEDDENILEIKDCNFLTQELVAFNCIKANVSKDFLTLFKYNRVVKKINWMDADWKLYMLIAKLIKVDVVKLIEKEKIEQYIFNHFTYKGKLFSQGILHDNFLRAQKNMIKDSIYFTYSANIRKAFSNYAKKIQQ